MSIEFSPLGTQFLASLFDAFGPGLKIGQSTSGLFQKRTLSSFLQAHAFLARIGEMFDERGFLLIVLNHEFVEAR